ncbi:hypothetical protein [Citricoccus nitrophenolicus]|uniref:hypothetical protein n=1 Tax=Citricoccus nitrophenolicus TaxID=863575 RepID=UPI0039B6B493
MDAGTGSLEESLSLALGFLPDIHLHGSLVLCALVVAWLTAIYRRAKKQPLSWSHRRKTMTRIAQSPPRDAARPAKNPAAAEFDFRVKWDRTALAAIALVGALVFVGTGVAAAFGASTLLVAGISALVTLAAVATLRVLAVRDRKKRADRRIEDAFDEAMSPALPAADPVATAAGSTTVFDAASGSSSAEAPAPAGRADAPSTDRADSGAAEAAGPEAAVLPSVPRPTYLDAGEARRPEPAPLMTPEMPMASPGVKLKSGVSAEYRAKVEATANRTVDLDKVLERRRAV